MNDFHGKVYSVTPQNVSRYLDSHRAPYIAINIKKKTLKLAEKPFNPNLITLSDQTHSLQKQSFPSPKRLKKPLKRPQELSFDLPTHALLSLSPAPNEKLKPENEESDSHSPTLQKNSPGRNLIKLTSFEGSEAVLEKIQMPPGVFPVSFKVKKKRKASNSVSSTMTFDRLNVPPVDNGKIESVLKTSATPTPEFKVPKYIRHESYKAGYFLGKIDKILNRIRVNRSRSGLNRGNQARNNLKNLIY